MENVASLSREELIELVKELDRRFIQLWDKVQFERVNNLTDYSKTTLLQRGLSV